MSDTKVGSQLLNCFCRSSRHSPNSFFNKVSRLVVTIATHKKYKNVNLSWSAKTVSQSLITLLRLNSYASNSISHLRL